MNKPTNYLFAGILSLSTLLLAPHALAQEQAAPSPESLEGATLLESPVSSALPLDEIMMLDPSREVRVASGVVGRDQTLVSVPYSYRRTAVLTADLISLRKAWLIPKPQVTLKAGAIGYWAGRFYERPKDIYANALISSAPSKASGYTDVWCFFGVDARDKPYSTCVRTNEDFDYELLFAGSRWYLPNITYEEVSTVAQLKFEERPVQFEQDLRLEYRFREWDAGDVDVLLYANGVQLSNRPARRQPDGSALYRSPAGELRLTQVGNSRQEANVTLTRNATSGTTKQPLVLKLSSMTPEDREKYVKRATTRLELARKRLASYETRVSQPLEVRVVGQDREGFFPIKWRDVLVRRSIQPAQVYRQKSSPQNRPDRFGAANALLINPLNEIDRRMLCLLPNGSVKQPEGINSKAYHCLEDRNGDGKYEWLIKDPTFFPNFMTENLYAFTSLETAGPVEVEIAPKPPLEFFNFDLIATGISKQTLAEDGQYRPAEYRFSLRDMSDRSLHMQYMNSPVIRNYNVELDRNGSGELRAADGTLLLEVRNAKMNGSAEVKLHALLKPGIGPIFDHSYEINRAKKALAAWEAIAASARAGEDLDLSLVLAEERD
jgi:hypothetical protein